MPTSNEPLESVAPDETPDTAAADNDAQPQSAKKPRRLPYPLLFRLSHWCLAGSVVVMFLSGLSLHASARPGWSLFSGVVPPLLWEGRVYVFHLAGALVFFSALVQAIRCFAMKKNHRQGIHYWLLGSGLALVASALMLLHPVGPAWLYAIARTVHASFGLVVMPAVFLYHAARGLLWNYRMLPNAFHPWADPRGWEVVRFLPVPVLVACIVLNGVPQWLGRRDVTASRIPHADRTDVQLASLPWKEARPLTIQLANGHGFVRGRTQVTLKAFHDDREVFIRAQWIDPVEDRQDMPWQKTQRGWKHLVTNKDDENFYYEDKFSLAFPTRPDWQFERFGCAAECHVGGGRRYGYKGSPHIMDVWHWKSTRTDSVGQVDDKYWSEVDLSREDAGRHGDPKDGGGYAKNFTPESTHPEFLPRDAHAVTKGVILKDRAVKYSEQAARAIPPGTIIPGIIAAAAEGDRGDVRCISLHKNGRWTVILRRKLITGSPYDVQFVAGEKYSFGCAAFDRSSKRHAYSHGVYRLAIEQ